MSWKRPDVHVHFDGWPAVLFVVLVCVMAIEPIARTINFIADLLS